MNNFIGSLFQTLMRAVICLSIGLPLMAHARWEGNGFATLSAGILDSDTINEANYFPYNHHDKSLSFDTDTRLGYQLSYIANDNVSTTVQVVARGENDFKPALDWAYVTYHTDNNIVINVGRLQRPGYTYSDHLNIGYTYAWIRPPISVYSPDLAYYHEIDGISLFYRWPLSNEWLGSVQSYYSGSSTENKLSTGETIQVKFRNDLGLILGLENQTVAFRLGYQRFPDTDVSDPSGATLLTNSLIAAGFPDVAKNVTPETTLAEHYNFSITYDDSVWLAGVEVVEIHLTDGGLAPDERSWYASLGRRFGDTTLQYTYSARKRRQTENYAESIYNAAAAMAPSNPLAAAGLSQLALNTTQAALNSDSNIYSHTLGLRYELNDSSALKLEYHWIDDKDHQLQNQLVRVAIDIVF